MKRMVLFTILFVIVGSTSIAPCLSYAQSGSGYFNDIKKHPQMKVRGVKRPSQLSTIPDADTAKQILENYSKNGSSRESPDDCGLKMMEEYLAFVEAGLTLTELISDLPIAKLFNQYNGNLCLLFSLRQVSQDIFEGKTDQTTLSLSKELTMYSLGKWGSSGLKIANIGIFLIDYSLTRFGTKAFEVREGVYTDRYNNFNNNHNRNYKNDEQWRDFLVKTLTESKDIKQTIDKELNTYSRMFFNEEGADTPDDLAQNLVKSEKLRIYKIFNDSIDEVMREVRLKKESEILNNITSARDVINREFPIIVNIIGGDVKSLPVSIVVKEDQNLWSGRTNEYGTWKMKCTYAGYLAYEKPTTIEFIYKGKRIYRKFDITEKGAYLTINLKSLDADGNSESESLTGRYVGKIYFEIPGQTRAEGPIEIFINDKNNITFKAEYVEKIEYLDETSDGIQKASGKLIQVTTKSSKIEGTGEFTNSDPETEILRLFGKLTMDVTTKHVDAADPYKQSINQNWAIFLEKKSNRFGVYQKYYSKYPFPYKVEVIRVKE